MANDSTIPATADPKKPVCFLISPIEGPATPTRRRANQFRKYIVQAAIGDRYEIQRADDFGEPGVITSHIITQILTAPMAVADLSGRNANVFYEIGLRHLAGKPVIHLIDKDDPIPFDVKDMNTIQFTLTDPESIEKSVEYLARFVDAVERDPKAFSNPVQQTIKVEALIKSSEGNQSANAVMLDMLERISGQMQTLGNRLEALERRGSVTQGAPYYSTSAVVGLPSSLLDTQLYATGAIRIDPPSIAPYRYGGDGSKPLIEKYIYNPEKTE